MCCYGGIFIKEFVSDLLHKVGTIEHYKIDDQTITKLFAHVGDSDGKLRDKGLYTLMVSATKKGCFTTMQLRKMKNQLLTKDYLFRDIQGDESDSVFWRSFSNLYLAVIVEHDRTTERFMSDQELSEIISSLCCYLVLEKDCRGFIEGKGWAHAFAHAGDLANQLAKHPQVDSVDLSLLTVTIFQKTTNYGKPFSFGEEERLVQCILTIVNKYPDFSFSLIHLIERQQVEYNQNMDRKELECQNKYYNTRRFYQQFLLSSATPLAVKQLLEEWR